MTCIHCALDPGTPGAFPTLEMVHCTICGNDETWDGPIKAIYRGPANVTPFMHLYELYPPRACTKCGNQKRFIHVICNDADGVLDVTSEFSQIRRSK